MHEAPESPKPKWLEFYDLAMACGAFSKPPPEPANLSKGDAVLSFAVASLPAATAYLEPILRL
jgi:hypothetical protein